MQEVQSDHYEEWFKPKFQELGKSFVVMHRCTMISETIKSCAMYCRHTQAHYDMNVNKLFFQIQKIYLALGLCVIFLAIVVTRLT